MTISCRVAAATVYFTYSVRHSKLNGKLSYRWANNSQRDELTTALLQDADGSNDDDADEEDTSLL